MWWIRFWGLAFGLGVLLHAGAALAQSNAGDAGSGTTSAADDKAAQMAVRLEIVQQVITDKREEREALEAQIDALEEPDRAPVELSIESLTSDIRKLENTLEQLATGGANDSLFVEAPPEQETDWRQDLSLIAEPVLDSLKDLTEKPRRVSEFNEQIAQSQRELQEAGRALQRLEQGRAATDDEALQSTLDKLIAVWQRRSNAARDALDVARLQLQTLEGDGSLLETLGGTLREFLRGRGLTLLLALLAAGTVYFLVRFLMRGYRRTLVSRDRPKSRTRYRLAEYSMRALTFLLVLVAVFVVFYERGDVLMLGLLILLIAGLALSVRQLLPRYIEEARLLLNIGGMREEERVIYRGLPWRVESINMFCILRNPELSGILRIPLADMHDVASRPIGDDTWFPTSKGDTILLNGTVFSEVISQNPDTVELRTGGGQIRSIPSSEFYAMEMVNLSRGDRFGVFISFGIDYAHQAISIDEVPRMLREAVAAELNSSDVGDFVLDTTIELKAAGSSSLDYVVFIIMDSRAAKSYLRIERMLQRACVRAATDNDLMIPYPHLSIVNKASEVSIESTEATTPS